MRRLASLAFVVFTTLATLLAPLGCGAGGRDAHDIASDLEGTVGPGTVERLARDVDLARAPLTISVGRSEVGFEAGEQPALESWLREAAEALAGDQVRVTQQVVEDTGPGTQRLTVTLAVESQGQTRFVPVVLDLLRDGRRMLVTRARVMVAGR